MIDKSNYEIYFIDYFDGTLDAQQVAELFLFLEKHPDLKADFESFENIKLDAPSISFSEKSTLKKNIVTPENFNEYAVANLEGSLSGEDKKMYNDFVASNASFKKEHDLFSKTKLQPDLNIVFQNKHSLKRGQKVFRLTPLYYTAAACILILLGFYFFSSFDKQQIQVANSQPEIKTAVSPTNKIEKINQPIENVVTENVNNNVSLAANNSKIKSSGNALAVKNKKVKSQIALPAHVQITTAPSIAVNEIENVFSELYLTPVFDLDESIADINNTIYDQDRSIYKNRVTIKEAAKKFAIKELNSFASSDVNLTEEEKKQTKKIRVLDVLATVVNKLTFKKVHIQTAYTPQGQLMAYSVSAGALNYEKNLLK